MGTATVNIPIPRAVNRTWWKIEHLLKHSMQLLKHNDKVWPVSCTIGQHGKERFLWLLLVRRLSNLKSFLFSKICCFQMIFMYSSLMAYCLSAQNACSLENPRIKIRSQVDFHFSEMHILNFSKTLVNNTLILPLPLTLYPFSLSSSSETPFNYTGFCPSLFSTPIHFSVSRHSYEVFTDLLLGRVQSMLGTAIWQPLLCIF